MGILIVVGVVFLIYAIIQKSSENGPFGAAMLQSEVTLPVGAEVVETSIGDGKVVLRLRLADGSGRLVVIDPETGKILGKIELKMK